MSNHQQAISTMPGSGGRLTSFLSLSAAWLVLAASLLVSILAWHFAQEENRKIEQAEFNAKVHDIELHLRQRMLAYEHVLQGAAGLFAASQNVERDEWRTYVNRLTIDTFYPGIEGIGFSQRVLPGEKERHVRQLRQQGFPAFSISPPGERAEYTSIIYLEPFSGRNPQAMGYDMFADPVRRAAIEQARDTGKASISSKVTLLHRQHENPWVGFLMYLPIYRNGALTTTEAQRRLALTGYVFSPFSMDSLMTGIFGSKRHDLEIEIYDGAEISPASVLYDSEPQHEQAPRLSSHIPLDVAGHRWLLAVNSPRHASNEAMPYHSYLILMAGVAISLLLFVVFRNMVQGRTSALKLARRMAADAIESAQHYRQLFDEAPLAIGIADAQTGKLLDLNRAMERLSGWGKAELVGKSQKILHPAEAQQVAVSNSFAQHLGSADGERIETQLLTKYGELLDVAIKASTLNLDGRKALIGFFSDITERKLYQQSLFKTNELLERIFANLRTLIAYMDADFNFIRVNQAYAAADGHSPEFFVGKNHFQLFPNQENEKVFREVLAHGLPYTVFAKPFVYERNKERGVSYWDWNVQPVKDTQGKVTGLVLSLLDRTEEKYAEEKLHLYGRALEASDNSIAIVDVAQPQLPLIYVNPAFTSITGYSAEEVLGRNPRFLLGSDREQPEMENIRGAIRENRDGHAVLRNYRKDGSQFWSELYVSPVWGDSGEVTHFIGLSRDITRRKSYETELERMANFDTLTGLANRNLFQDRLAQAIVHAQRNGGIIALAVLDLDGFKLVNDSLGHHSGDLILKEVAARLSATVRELDTVARLGGDEFVIAMPELAKAEDAVLIADKLLKAFAETMLVGVQDLYISASIGITLYPQDGEDAESLLKHAELAMYRAKDGGRNHYQFYAPEMNQRAAESLGLGNDLHRALQHNELSLNYQPQVDLKSGNIVGVEALLRWHHPKLGWVSPAKFIPVAEECGLIVPIGKWVLQQACLAAKAWHDQGLSIVVAVNLSARQIRERGFVQSVRDALDSSGLEARYLELELTEGILIEQAEYVFEVLQQLRAMGIVLALDDFGTGYSSLSYLKRFPIGRLKIDQSFVRDIVSDPEDAAIVGAIISMAHDLKLKVIAEGVETREQLAFLRQRRCDEIQGYYFSKPKPGAEITAMLQAGTTLAPEIQTGGQAPAVLLVEDEENIRGDLVQLLRRDGCHVLRTGSAQDALGLLASHRVDVIVADQHLPEMSGTELLRRAKQLHPDSMRMLLSDYADLKSVTDAINESAVYKFLPKSWDSEHLREQIREAMQSYEIKKAHDSLVQQLAAANQELTLAKQLLERKVDQTLLDSLNSIVTLKASQEVLDCLPNAVISVDLNGVINVANKSACAILGAEIQGRLAAAILPAALQDLLQQALQEGSVELRGWTDARNRQYDCFTQLMCPSADEQGLVMVLVSRMPPDSMTGSQ